MLKEGDLRASFMWVKAYYLIDKLTQNFKAVGFKGSVLLNNNFQKVKLLSAMFRETST